ncbi:hypothetical protein ACXHPE_03970 [Vibrio cincinnatiensis]|jgi:hypothetical protein
MIPIIVAAVTGLIDIFKSKAERKSRIEEAKTAATIERIKSGDEQAASLDAISLQSRGWKDEYLLLITTIPVLLAFVPDLAPYVKQGFDVLKDSVPEYYWYALAMIYIDTFGFRRMMRVAFENWINKKLR